MNFRRSLPEFRCQACLSPVRSQLKPLSCGIEPGDRGFSVKRFPFLDWMRGLAVLIIDRKSTRLNSSHANISYAVFCLKKKHRTTIHALLTVARPATLSVANTVLQS